MTVIQTNATNISALPGLQKLWSETQGDAQICVAILDGPLDPSHPCFDGANLTVNSNAETASTGLMSSHGTHITSVIFGQHGSSVPGIAPGCRGLIVPVFSDHRPGSLSQIDLARAINQAVEQGAHVINISGGQLAQGTEADPILAQAVKFCHDSGVLIVAAAGNDGCQCLHVPAALPEVLAVGAMNAQGLPFDFSNWGETYKTQGILAPGENILGAKPGGGLTTKSGTSFATPLVSGIVALLLSVQVQRGEEPNPHAVREALFKSALPCNPEVIPDCRRFLVGSLNIPGAYDLIIQGGTKKLSEEKLEEAMIQPSEATSPSPEPSANPISDVDEFVTEEVTTSEWVTEPVNHLENTENTMTPAPSQLATPSVTPSSIEPSENCGCNSGGATPPVYAMGTVSYDFGTEARRDSFKQLMPMVEGNPPFPANPFVVSQMADYLEQNPYEAKSLIWTLNLELTPIYAIEPVGPYAELAYQHLISAIKGQVKPEDDPEYISRVSIPGILTGKSVRLFSGQVVPVIIPEVRGMYEWNVNQLVTLAAEAATTGTPQTQVAQQEEATRASLKEFLNRMYYEFRNLGQTSQERALNFAATNAFQAAQALTEATGKGMQLDRIETEKSPFCRMDSDCWDVKLKFFDPENNRRAKKVFRFTVDVSDMMPVTIGEMRTWSIAD
jgi:cyanobactin maturation PatA/PatG family protease